MCPLCIGTATLLISSATSGGAATALLLGARAGIKRVQGSERLSLSRTQAADAHRTRSSDQKSFENIDSK